MSANTCPRCGDRQGHSPVPDAACALWQAATQEITRYATTLDQPPATGAVLDLLAFLSRHLGAEPGYKAARDVLDLGWRPALGVHATLPPPAPTVDVALPDGEGT